MHTVQGVVTLIPPKAGTPVRLRGQRGLFERLSLSSDPVAQTGNPRAPEHNGFWAFPFGWFDLFFAYHAYDAVLPKHLRGDAVDWEERAAWIRGPGRTSMRRRQFWWDGPVWSRLTPAGERAGDTASNSWYCHPSPVEFSKAFARFLGRGGLYGPNRGPCDDVLYWTRWGIWGDEAEVFLPTDAGRGANNHMRR